MSSALALAQKLQPGLDVRIRRIKLCCSLVGIQSVGDLIVAALVKSAQIIPNLADVRVQSDCSGVSIERITVLVDLVVEHSNRTPEGWVSTVSVDSLLVCFVCFGILLLRHVATTEQVPALRIVVVSAD